MEKNKYELSVFEVRERILNDTLDKEYIKQKIEELTNNDLEYRGLYELHHKSAMSSFQHLKEEGLLANSDLMFVEEATLVNMLASDTCYRMHEHGNINLSNISPVHKNRLVYCMGGNTGVDIEASKYALIPRQFKEVTGINVLEYPQDLERNNVLLFQEMLESEKPDVLEVIQKYHELKFCGVRDDEINAQMREFYKQKNNFQTKIMLKRIEYITN